MKKYFIAASSSTILVSVALHLLIRACTLSKDIEPELRTANCIILAFLSGAAGSLLLLIFLFLTVVGLFFRGYNVKNKFAFIVSSTSLGIVLGLLFFRFTYTI